MRTVDECTCQITFSIIPFQHGLRSVIMRWRRQRPLIYCLRLFWILLILWFEIGVFHYASWKCAWPDAMGEPSATMTHVAVISDPQILDHRSYPERGPLLSLLSQVFTDVNLRRNWGAVRRTAPDVVVFLGDMIDGGRHSLPDEYEQYYARFKSIFASPADIPTYYIPGNHDTGLGDTLSHDTHTRYVTHFGPRNQVISYADHTLVLLDAPGLVEEDRVRQLRGSTFSDWHGGEDSVIGFVNSLPSGTQEQPVIVFSHIPFYRPGGTKCGTLREKGTIRMGIGQGYQNTLGEEMSRWLLERLKPILIFSGDDHDYCEHYHTLESGSSATREVTVKSLSMAMGIRRPGFQMLSLTPQVAENFPSDRPCIMPDQLGIYLSVYVPAIVASILILFLSNFWSLCSRTMIPPYRTNAYSLRQGPENLPLPYNIYPAPRNSSFISRLLLLLKDAVDAGWTSRSPPLQTKRGFLRGFIIDIRNVAAVPVMFFLVIMWWTLR